MENAPLFDDIAKGPDGGSAFWVNASDGVRLRVAHWPGGTKGTVLLFPGRTEYIEKYGPAAADLQALGYGTLTIDWRSQGLSDRLTDDPMLGHVGDFADYQLDVVAMVAVAKELNCQRPYYLMGHSMGGCIGLRALHNRLDVKAVGFTGPMWGLHMSAFLHTISGPLTAVLSAMGQGENYAPTTKNITYVKDAVFQNNMLTTDPDMWAFMQQQATAHPELTLAGPSVSWLRSALVETGSLQRTPTPIIPTVTHIGSLERIVDPVPVKAMMAGWKNGQLEIVPGCEHEIILEKPTARAAFFAAADRLFSGVAD